MYATYRLAECVDDPPFDLVSGPSYWVSLVSNAGNSNDIIQIGVIKCSNAAYDPPCNGTGRLFWAYGGCGITPVPIVRDIAAAPSSGAELKIERLSTGYYRLTADYDQDGTPEYTKSIWKGDSHIVCWADTGIVKSQIACERWDSGDMCGSSLDRAAAHGIKAQKSVGGTWYNPGLTAAYCDESNSETQCLVLDSDSAQFWTAQ